MNDLGPWQGARTQRIWPYIAEALLVTVLITAGGLGVLLLILAMASSVRP